MIRLSHLFIVHEGDGSAASYCEDVYLPLAAALPHMLRLEHARLAQPSMGDLHVARSIDQYFENEEMMDRAMASPAGRRLAAELMSNPRRAPQLFVFTCEELPAAGSGMEAAPETVSVPGAESIPGKESVPGAQSVPGAESVPGEESIP